MARNHALVDGNKRLALAAAIAFLGVNGRRLTFSNDQAYDLIIAVAAVELDEVPTIADRVRHATTRPADAIASVRPLPSGRVEQRRGVKTVPTTISLPIFT